MTKLYLDTQDLELSTLRAIQQDLADYMHLKAYAKTHASLVEAMKHRVHKPWRAPNAK